MKNNYHVKAWFDNGSIDGSITYMKYHEPYYRKNARRMKISSTLCKIFNHDYTNIDVFDEYHEEGWCKRCLHIQPIVCNERRYE